MSSSQNYPCLSKIIHIHINYTYSFLWWLFLATIVRWAHHGPAQFGRRTWPYRKTPRHFKSSFKVPSPVPALGYQWDPKATFGRLTACSDKGPSFRVGTARLAPKTPSKRTALPYIRHLAASHASGHQVPSSELDYRTARLPHRAGYLLGIILLGESERPFIPSQQLQWLRHARPTIKWCINCLAPQRAPQHVQTLFAKEVSTHPTMVSTQQPRFKGKKVDTGLSSQNNLFAELGQQVDTASEQVDTGPCSQNSCSQIWDNVSTPPPGQVDTLRKDCNYLRQTDRHVLDMWTRTVYCRVTFCYHSSNGVGLGRVAPKGRRATPRLLNLDLQDHRVTSVGKDSDTQVRSRDAARARIRKALGAISLHQRRGKKPTRVKTWCTRGSGLARIHHSSWRQLGRWNSSSRAAESQHIADYLLPWSDRLA
ncbi:hypothetical protein Taro_013497 [Colocasia esculenta]|uniref:Uncharacterized protein n=1 Tax=Colocasia esculenta TaxID=4460 RepID=A0A843UIX5_COLES|nr:hypothetical protein [Colocasia esculenta]